MLISEDPRSCLKTRSELIGAEDCLENTSLFLLSNIQYISTVLTYSRGDVFREAIYNNEWFVINVMLGFGFSLFLMISDGNNMICEWLGLVKLSDSSRTTLIIASLINLLVTIAFEMIIKVVTKVCKKPTRA